MNLSSLPIPLRGKEIRTFIGSSILPAAVLMLANIYAIRTFLHGFDSDPGRVVPFFENPWIVLPVLAVGIGFYLYSASDTTINLFAGYFFPARIARFLAQRNRRILRRRTEPIQEPSIVSNATDGRSSSVSTMPNSREIVGYKVFGLIGHLQEDEVMPTELGNVLRSIDNCAQRYGITDLSPLWPRLVFVLPQSILKELGAKKNQLLFLLNLSFLSYISSSIYVAYFLVEWGRGLRQIDESLFASLGFFVLGYNFYRISIPAAVAFGLLVRSSVDSFRFDLLRALSLKQPDSLEEEKRTWQQISESMIGDGRFSTAQLEFEYLPSGDKEKDTSPKADSSEPVKSSVRSIPASQPVKTGGAAMFSSLLKAGNLFAQIGTILERITRAKPGDVKEIAASQIELLSSYYELVLTQARISFRWARIWAGVGAGVFIICVILIVVAKPPDATSVTILGGIGGALVEVISGINFYLYNKSSSQLAEFHSRLDTTQRHLLANSICESLEADWQQRTRAQVALAVIGARVDIPDNSIKTPNVQIVHIEYDPPGKDVEGEYVKIGNFDQEAVNLTSWRLKDNAEHCFEFPDFTLEPGKYVKIWTHSGENSLSDLFWNSKRPIWNNTGDHAYLFDKNGNPISDYLIVVPIHKIR